MNDGQRGDSPTKATYVFIHGAGDVGWYWHLVEAELRKRGHDTVAPDLPVEDDAAGLTDYADVVIDAIGERDDLIVVAQSFGGYVAPIVCDRVSARLLVLVAGMVPSPGESAEEMFSNTGWQQEKLNEFEPAGGLLPRCPSRPGRPGAGQGTKPVRHAWQRALAPLRLARRAHTVRPVSE